MSRQSLRTALALAASAVAVALLAYLAVREADGDDHEAGSPPTRACTLIGCTSGVRVQLTRVPADVRTARVCVDGACGAPRRLDRPVPLTAKLPRSARRDGEVVRVSVRLLDGEGDVIVRMSGRAPVRRTRPNGPDCPPVCFQARLRLDGVSAPGSRA